MHGFFIASPKQHLPVFLSAGWRADRKVDETAMVVMPELAGRVIVR